MSFTISNNNGTLVLEDLQRDKFLSVYKLDGENEVWLTVSDKDSEGCISDVVNIWLDVEAAEALANHLSAQVAKAREKIE